jgi:hypothetical protein
MSKVLDEKELREQIANLIHKLGEGGCDLPVACPKGVIGILTCENCITRLIMSLVKANCWPKGEQAEIYPDMGWWECSTCHDKMIFGQAESDSDKIQKIINHHSQHDKPCKEWEND